MQIAYFDCFHGAAGDMLLASLLDAGLELAALEAALAALPLSGYTIEWQRVVSHHVAGSRLRVRVATAQPARNWATIRTMLEQSNLPPRARHWALGAFARLARAEAAIHGVAADDVHFHEIGAVDSIIDTVGVCVGLDLLGVERIYASPLPLGNGWVRTQHGYLPVPAPATLALLAEVGAPLLPTATRGELVTPTAAALLAELATFSQPALRLRRIGYGFGHKEFDRLNGLRVWLGNDEATQPTPHSTSTHHHTHEHEHGHDHHEHHTHHHHEHEHSHADTTNADRPAAQLETVIELRCNLDDATGEVIAYTIERLLAAGALDAWAAPLVMKKGRPALQLACLARPDSVDTLARLILHETPTLGVRWQAMARLAAERQIVQVATPWGSVRLKQKLIEGVVVASAPEYEDCAKLARTHNVPLAQIYAAALDALHSISALG